MTALATAPACAATSAATAAPARRLPNELVLWDQLRETLRSTPFSRTDPGLAGVGVSLAAPAVPFGRHLLVPADEVRVTVVAVRAAGLARRGVPAVLAYTATPRTRNRVPTVSAFRARVYDLAMRPWTADREDRARRRDLAHPAHRLHAAARGGPGGERAAHMHEAIDLAPEAGSGRSGREARLAVSLWETVTAAAIRRGRYPGACDGFVYGAEGSKPSKDLPRADRCYPAPWVRLAGPTDPGDWADLVTRHSGGAFYASPPLVNAFLDAFAGGLPFRAPSAGTARRAAHGFAFHPADGGDPVVLAGSLATIDGSPVKPGDVVGFCGPDDPRLRRANREDRLAAAEAWAHGHAGFDKALASWVGHQRLDLGGVVYAPSTVAVTAPAWAVDDDDLLLDVAPCSPHWDAGTGAYRLPPAPVHGPGGFEAAGVEYELYAPAPRPAGAGRPPADPPRVATSAAAA